MSVTALCSQRRQTSTRATDKKNVFDLRLFSTPHNIKLSQELNISFSRNIRYRMRNRFLTFFAWLQMLSVFPTLPERSKTVAHPKQNKKCHVLAQILQIGMIPHNITSFKFICALYQFHRQTLFITKIGAKSNFESMFQLVPYIYNASNKDLFLKSPRNVKNSKFPVTSFYVLITARVICPTAELLVNIGYRESI